MTGIDAAVKDRDRHAATGEALGAQDVGTDGRAT